MVYQFVNQFRLQFFYYQSTHPFEFPKFSFNFTHPIVSHHKNDVMEKQQSSLSHNEERMCYHNTSSAHKRHEEIFFISRYRRKYIALSFHST